MMQHKISYEFLGYLNYIFFFQDITKLTPLSPEVISRQATINIGTIGHVAHGKSTVVKAISGVQTVRFKNELERNITIKLGESFVCFVVYLFSSLLSTEIRNSSLSWYISRIEQPTEHYYYLFLKEQEFPWNLSKGSKEYLRDFFFAIFSALFKIF